MIPRRKHILLGFVAICMALCAGCGSLESKGLNPVIDKALIAPVTEPLRDLYQGAREFRVSKDRWPKDFPELSDFLKQSDSAVYRKLQVAQLSVIEFSDAPNGWLKIKGQILLPGGTYTDSGTSLTVPGGTANFETTMAPVAP